MKSVTNYIHYIIIFMEFLFEVVVLLDNFRENFLYMDRINILNCKIIFYTLHIHKNDIISKLMKIGQ